MFVHLGGTIAGIGAENTRYRSPGGHAGTAAAARYPTCPTGQGRLHSGKNPMSRPGTNISQELAAAMTDVVHSRQQAARRLDRSVVTIGNFDGMHIGHQAIFRRAVELAGDRDASAVALTFEPHPEAFFRPDEAPERLSPPPYKFDLMGRYGVDVVVALEFDESIAGLEPEDFVEQVLVRDLGAEHVVVGQDFRFGKKRAGDTDSLRRIGAPLGMGCTVEQFVQWQQKPVSSTRIRAAVNAGEMEAVEAMLDRPYRLYGEVVPGQERGRQLGFPTANMEVVQMALPPKGVYVTTLGRRGSGHWQAITNIGTRPTFDGEQMTVETFVLDDRVDDDLDLYGDQVELDLLRRLRGERKFDSPQQLVDQIERDVRQARAFFDDQE